MTEIPWFRRVQGEQLARLEREQPGASQRLRDEDGIDLFGTIGSDGILKADGSVVITTYDDALKPVTAVALGKDRIGALVLGSRRIPDVATLLPARDAAATDCPRCVGFGEINGGVLCYHCGGIGWISSGT